MPTPEPMEGDGTSSLSQKKEEMSDEITLRNLKWDKYLFVHLGIDSQIFTIIGISASRYCASRYLFPHVILSFGFQAKPSSKINLAILKTTVVDFSISLILHS